MKADRPRWYVHLELYCPAHSYPATLKERQVRDVLDIADKLGRWRNVQSNGYVTHEGYPLYRTYRVPKPNEAHIFVYRFIEQLYDRQLLTALRNGSIRIECRTDGKYPTISQPEEHV